MGVKYT